MPKAVPSNALAPEIRRIVWFVEPPIGVEQSNVCLNAGAKFRAGGSLSSHILIDDESVQTRVAREGADRSTRRQNQQR